MSRVTYQGAGVRVVAVRGSGGSPFFVVEVAIGKDATGAPIWFSIQDESLFRNPRDHATAAVKAATALAVALNNLSRAAPEIPLPEESR